MANNTSHLLSFVTNVPTGHDYNQSAWVRLNHPCTDTGWFASLMFKSGLTTTASCDCASEPEFLPGKMGKHYWMMIQTVGCSISAQISDTADLETTPHTKKKK